MSNRSKNRLRLVLLTVAAPVAVALIVLLARAVLGGDTALDVLYREDGRPALQTTRGDALKRLQARVGFRPAIPDRLPFDGFALTAVDSFVPPAATDDTPRSRLEFVGRLAEGKADTPRVVLIVQAETYWGPALDGWQRRDVPGEVGLETWEFPYPASAPGGEYWIMATDAYIYVTFMGFRPPESEVEALLKDLAGQVATP